MPQWLKKRRDFVYIAQLSRQYKSSFRSQNFICQTAPLHNQCLIGLTVTKKIGNAVVRNRNKRRLRAALSEIENTHNTVFSNNSAVFSFVLIVRCDISALEFSQLVKEIGYLLTKAHSRAKPIYKEIEISRRN